jgi:hypothetical protein
MGRGVVEIRFCYGVAGGQRRGLSQRVKNTEVGG